MTQDQANSIQQIEQLPSQIAQFLQLLELFQEALLSEAQALKSNHTVQLSAAISVKNELSEKISRLTQAIEKRLNTQQLTLSILLSSNLPPNLSKTMQQSIQRLILLTNQCHDLNQANGISIQILNNINQHTLKIISRQESPNIKLYSSSGETQTSTPNKKTLGKA